MEKKKLYRILAGAAVLLIAIIVYIVTRPLPELEIPVQQTLELGDQVSKEGVFSLIGLQTDKTVYKLDDGQGWESDKPKRVMKFTWEPTGDPYALMNPYLTFAVVDEDGNEVIEHLYGDYSNVLLTNGEGSAIVPVLCSTQPVESCAFGDEFNPTEQYRVQATIIDCSEFGENPLICSRGEQETISVAYSNWFQFEI